MADDALTAPPPGGMAPQQRTALFSILAAVFLVGLKLVTGLLTAFPRELVACIAGRGFKQRRQDMKKLDASRNSALRLTRVR